MNSRAIRDITDFIFLQDSPQKSDVIFLPGTSQSEISERAAALYLEGFAPVILPSGKYSSKNGRFAREKIENPRYFGEFETDFSYCKFILRENGIPEEAILREDRAENSMENAEFSAEAVKQAGITVKKAILCCQSFHARRIFLSYARFFPEVEIFVVPTDTQGISPENWYQTEASYRKVIGELEKCGKYFLNAF